MEQMANSHDLSCPPSPFGSPSQLWKKGDAFDLLSRLCPRSYLPVLFGDRWPEAWILLSAHLLVGGMLSISGLQGSPLPAYNS